jgi:hypothetical protein
VKNLEHYKALLAIDPDNILDDIIHHAELCSEVGDRAVAAVAERDAAKLTVEQLEAELDGRHRAKLANTHDKVTEVMVKSAIKDDSKMAKAQEDYLAAKLAADEWNKLDGAFHTRSGMLRLATGVLLRTLMMDEEFHSIERSAGALRAQQGEKARKADRERYRAPARKRKAS